MRDTEDGELGKRGGVEESGGRRGGIKKTPKQMKMKSFAATAGFKK